MDPVLEFEIFFNDQTSKHGLSLREFSKQIDLDASTVSKILDRKRPIPKTHALQLATFIFADKERQEKFVHSVISKKSINKKEKYKRNTLKLNEDNFEYFQVISQWEYFAILNLLKIKKINHTPQNISKKLGINLRRTKQCLELLISLGFIKKTDETYIRQVKSIKTTNEVWSRALQMSHAEELEIAKNKLHIDFKVKDFQSMTFAISIEHLAKIKALTQKLYDAIDEISEKNLDDAEEVYLFSSQLVPLTNVFSKNEMSESIQ